MPMIMKLSTYTSSPGSRARTASRVAPSGARSSRAMMVMITAITPSLNASTRAVPISRLRMGSLRRSSGMAVPPQSVSGHLVKAHRPDLLATAERGEWARRTMVESNLRLVGGRPPRPPSGLGGSDGAAAPGAGPGLRHGRGRAPHLEEVGSILGVSANGPASWSGPARYSFGGATRRPAGRGCTPEPLLGVMPAARSGPSVPVTAATDEERPYAPATRRVPHLLRDPRRRGAGRSLVGLVRRPGGDQRRVGRDHARRTGGRPGGPPRPAGQGPRPRPEAPVGPPHPTRRPVTAPAPDQGGTM